MKEVTVFLFCSVVSMHRSLRRRGRRGYPNKLGF
jgi:hypothetical protein